MSEKVYEFEGFKELVETVNGYIESVDNSMEILEVGANEFTMDLLRLAKPMSKIRKSGYTHLIKSFSYKKKKDEIEVGWGKYYGPMLEHGTQNMNSQPHINPLWNKNKEKYYKLMLTKADKNI